MDNKLIISASPHIYSGDTIEKRMYGVIFALIPALIVSFIYFGLGALIITLASVGSCVLFEFIIQKYLLKKKTTIKDGSAIITGLLLAFNLPSNLPIWIVMIGALIAIGVGKMTFGGLGKNIFNPALVGRVFLLISFPAQMTTWPKPGFFPLEYLDAVTGPTILNMVSNRFGNISSYNDLLLGNIGGSMGEVSAIALLLGFIYMLWKKIIRWHIPVVVISTVFLFTGIMHIVDPSHYSSPLIHILSGGLLLGSIFMATDYATSPMTTKGMVIYAFGIGIITSVIRLWGIYPEGISFAILIMNAVTPLLNTYLQPNRFGKEVSR
ncbi:RnfABCDGE type electron transport complex subunit D [Bacteroidales bacterium OttesenSCG-928-M11]|nr:RnfABCDGE type electron transport complex subunit D [Bacteroidales bacterium OttesenSCG-928-M11]